MIPRRYLPISIIALIAAIGFGFAPLALLIALILVTSEAARLWADHALDRLEYHRHFGQTRAFFDESIDFEVQIVNRKPLPLPWLEVEDEIPDGLPLQTHSGHPVDMIQSGKPKRALLSNLFSLGPYERITRRYHLRCALRGHFAFGPAAARSGDVFGFGQQEREVGDYDWLLVYPRILPVERFGLPAKRPFGDLRARERIFEDPSRLRAIRPFEPGDPLRRVHWKATARTGSLQVKQFDPSATLDLLLVVNVATFEQAWQGVRNDLLETVISVAASSASHALGDGFPVGLLVNAPLPGTDQYVKIAPGRGPDQLLGILEALAKLSGFVTQPLESVLRRERRALPWGATIVVVTAVAGEDLLALLLAFKKSGHRVVLILVGDTVAGSLPGIDVYSIIPEASGVNIG